METPTISITLCMGSSCFSRGNNVNAESIERFLEENKLSGKIEVRGCLCEGHCKEGPNIRINGELLQGIEPGMLFDLLQHKLGKADE
jgi:NADH:ubiquinone oxidoreductase subunit E